VALGLCHFDENGTDLGGVEGGDRCEAACYNCLLSYYNQIVHDLLDRRLAAPLLAAMARGAVDLVPAGSTPAERLDALRTMATSELERQWLDVVRATGYHLPEEAQPFLAEVPARPDFAYWSKDAVVYLDGPWHEFPERRERDEAHRAQIRNLGLRVIEFREPAGWAEVFEVHRDVFGKAD
jgi:very-short-patch-repair endonuclease